MATKRARTVKKSGMTSASISLPLALRRQIARKLGLIDKMHRIPKKIVVQNVNFAALGLKKPPLRQLYRLRVA